MQSSLLFATLVGLIWPACALLRLPGDEYLNYPPPEKEVKAGVEDTTAVTPHCPPEDYTGARGSIQSPNYPGNYSNRMDCDYKITVNENHLVEIHFTHFNTERFYDHVDIFDGLEADAPRIVRLSGTSVDADIAYVSTTNKMRLHFHSDYIAVRTGFKANFAQIDSSGSFVCQNRLLRLILNEAVEKYPNNMFLLTQNALQHTKVHYDGSWVAHAVMSHSYYTKANHSFQEHSDQYCHIINRRTHTFAMIVRGEAHSQDEKSDVVAQVAANEASEQNVESENDSKHHAFGRWQCKNTVMKAALSEEIHAEVNSSDYRTVALHTYDMLTTRLPGRQWVVHAMLKTRNWETWGDNAVLYGPLSCYVLTDRFYVIAFAGYEH